MTTRHQVAITIASGLILVTAVLLVVLVQAPKVIIATDDVDAARELGLFGRNATVCQAGERIPASTTALRISLRSQVGPAVFVTVSRGDQIVARGYHNAGWASASPTFPLEVPVASALDGKLCLTRSPGGLPVELSGDTARALAATMDGKPLPGRLRVEYLTRGHRSWLSLAPNVARRLGLGHTPSGTWIVIPLAVMMAAALALGAWLLLREAST